MTMSIRQAKAELKLNGWHLPRPGREMCITSEHKSCGCDIRTYLRNTAGTYSVPEFTHHCFACFQQSTTGALWLTIRRTT